MVQLDHLRLKERLGLFKVFLELQVSLEFQDWWPLEQLEAIK
jgi:hypothetical protein